MIISPQAGYIFVHIPKTGGTSLALALEARARKDDILIGDTPKALRRRSRLARFQTSGRLWKHSRLTDIYGIVDDADIARMTVFTIVRNPWARMVSYYHWLRGQDFDHPAVGIARDSDFAAFLGHPHTQASVRGAPYASYLRTRHGTERCDAFLRLERIDEDAGTLGARLGFRVGPLPHANASDRPGDWRSAYTPATRALVAEICAEDIARFGYAF